MRSLNNFTETESKIDVDIVLFEQYLILTKGKVLIHIKTYNY